MKSKVNWDLNNSKINIKSLHLSFGRSFMEIEGIPGI